LEQLVITHMSLQAQFYRKQGRLMQEQKEQISRGYLGYVPPVALHFSDPN